MPKTIYRTCSLCEACCGLAFEVENNRILSVRPDEDDVLSRGHVCPKGVAMRAVHHDPDRVRAPLRRRPDGEFEPISWDDAFGLVAARLTEVQQRHGRDAVALYIGNPVVHNHGALLLRKGLVTALGTRNCFSAGSQDTSPRFASSYYLYGSSFAVPIPDVDATQYLLCIGANPLVSNGSFLSAPNMRARLRALRQRGGKLVVVDPRESETAREADEHVAVRPGSDAALLLSMVQVLAARGRVDRVRLERITSGWSAVESRLAAFAPQRVAEYVGIPAETIERLAIEFAEAPSSVAYSRVGVCNNAFGTLATYATDLLNLCAGRLGVAGGALFPAPAIDIVEILRMIGGDGHGRWKTRVRGLPETLGDLPAAALAEEIEEPGQGQIRALVTFAGNPVLSTPNGRRLDRALGGLDFMVAIDIYVNETTRHADVILPTAWSLADDHVDVIFSDLFIRNVARWSPPVVEPEPGDRADWEILLELTERLGGGPTGMPFLDRLMRVARRFGYRWTPTATLDLLLRIGPYGDRFLPFSKGLNLRKLKAAPHGIDLGPLTPGFERRVLHKDRRIHLGAEPMLNAIDEAAAQAAVRPDPNELLLVGRREVRTNNSWMHNVPGMVAGRERCVLLVHPDDALQSKVGDGEIAILESRVHSGEVRVQLSPQMRPGVVSLPHGWGHAAAAPWQKVAGSRPGVSVNDWTDDQKVETTVGQSILNGVPVRLGRVLSS